jgi:protein farnesyltransferase subunit beta
LAYAYQWTVDKFQPVAGEEEVFDEIDRVGMLHPIFVVPEGVAEQTRDYFVAKGGFS